MDNIGRKQQKANGKIVTKKKGKNAKARKQGKAAGDRHAQRREVLINYLSALGYGETEKVHGQALPPKGAKATMNNRPVKLGFTIKRLREDPGLMDMLVDLNETRGIFIRPNAGGHTDDEVTSFKAVFAEFDDLPIERQLEIFRDAPLPATALVVTRRSVHYYARIDGGCAREQWEDSQQGGIAYFGSDPGVKNASRLMRAPGFDHLSIGEDGQLERKRVECVLLEPSRRYTVQQMQEAFPPVENGPKRARALGEDEPIRNLTRNTTLASLAGTFRRRGLGDEEIFAALAAVNERRCDPPLGEDEVWEIARSISRYDPDRSFPLTDLGNAERLVERHGDDLLFCHDTGKWHVWDGKRYQEDSTAAVIRMAKETVRSIYIEVSQEHDDAKRAALLNWAKQSESERHINAMIAWPGRSYASP